MKYNEILVKPINNANYTSVLEEGDYIPYFVHKNGNNKISIQNSAGKPNLFITVENCDKNFYEKNMNILTSLTTYFICKKTSYKNMNIIDDENIYKLFPKNKFILTTPNLKIHKISDNFKDIDFKEIKQLDPPIIIVPNVISESLKNELISFHDKSNRKNIELKGTKNRTHVFTDNNLTKKLDDKLSKSLFPELKKIFNVEITHRENYKICSYNAEDKGKFHAHRDSVYPYGHRRFAMSLILNDDYKDGGIIFPEYNNKTYKPEPCSAVIFPTPLYHQVLEVSEGTRYVIISFLFGDHEAEYKKEFNKYQRKMDNTRSYKINVVRDQRNVLIDDICPQ